MLFSLISWALWAFWYTYYTTSQSWFFASPEEKEVARGEASTLSSQAGGLDEDSIRDTDTTRSSMAESFQDILARTVQDIAPSVVSIVIKKDLVIYRSDPWGFFQQPAGTVRRQVWGGSGFFVTTDGTLITNKHVVSDRDAEYTIILSDGTEYNARVLALDPINDLAVMKITDWDQAFTPLKIIENTDEIQVWEFAIAIGNALAEFQNSVSLGIVSGKDRAIEAQGESLSGLIQTDAAINPGNSWGPLLDLDWRVMGVNTAIVNGSNGIWFSIALTQDRIDYMLESIAQDGRIKRPFIGINYIQNSPWIAAELWLKSEYWAYIIDEPNSIVEWSSADQSGLEPGDIILEIDEKKIDGQITLGSIVQNAIPGEILNLKVLKKSWEEKNIELELWEY